MIKSANLLNVLMWKDACSIEHVKSNFCLCSCVQSIAVFLPWVSQNSGVQLADKQRAMNHWMFSPLLSVES